MHELDSIIQLTQELKAEGQRFGFDLIPWLINKIPVLAVAAAHAYAQLAQ